jgi:hypothetical protein
MSDWRRIVILANSTKRHNRCVAGKVISWDDTQYHATGWIRPIDRNEAEGAVSVKVMRCEDGSYPQVLDIVDVPVLGHAADPNHPEDWVIDRSRRWKRVQQFPAALVHHLCDDGSNLWNQPSQSRRVLEGYVTKMANPASLMLVKPPSGWKMSLFKDTNFEGRIRTKSRLSFSLGGHDHLFDNNDPHIHTHYAEAVSVPLEGEVIIPFREPESLYFTLSLTPAFKGWHYKILAAVIRGASA